MLFPTGDAYMLAVQHPRTAFVDPELQASAVETTPLGLPKPYSGGFATTFRFGNNGSQWAVRCFKQDIPDLPRRYTAISRLWRGVPDPLFVRAEYLSQGIRVGRDWYPVVKMDWVQGELLNQYIEGRLYHPRDILALANQFRALVRRLQQLGAAHGDLQHGNIIIQEGKPRLIDYDGVYMPELAGIKVAEVGHVNYQHPQRTHHHYTAHLDRFSTIIIYLGLLAIGKAPSLWRKYDNGDNLLFRQADFLAPDHSPLLADMAVIADLAPLVERFRQVSRADLDAVPTLDAFIEGAFAVSRPSVRPSSSAPVRQQYPVVDALRLGSLREYVGSRIEVVGEIVEYHQGLTQEGAPYLFLMFGSGALRTLTLVLWSKVLADMNDKGVDPLAFVGKSVRATGVVTLYQGRPQMEIETASQLRVIISDAVSSDELLAPGSAQRNPIAQPDARAADVFNTLYHDAAKSTQPSSPKSKPQPQMKPAPAKPATTVSKPQPTAAAAPTPSPVRPPVAAQTPSQRAPVPVKEDAAAQPDCFVATVAFGGPDAADVQALRAFRDQTLVRYRAGRLFTTAYYRYGPRLAGIVARHAPLRRAAAFTLHRFVTLIEKRRSHP